MLASSEEVLYFCTSNSSICKLKLDRENSQYIVERVITCPVADPCIMQTVPASVYALEKNNLESSIILLSEVSMSSIVFVSKSRAMLRSDMLLLSGQSPNTGGELNACLGIVYGRLSLLCGSLDGNSSLISMVSTGVKARAIHEIRLGGM